MRPRVGRMQGTSPGSGVDPWDLVETNEADEEDEDEDEDDAWGDPWGPGVTVGYDDTQCVDAWLTQSSDSESHNATQAEDVGRLVERQQMRESEMFVSDAPWHLRESESESDEQDATWAEDVGRPVERQQMRESEVVSATPRQPGKAQLHFTF